MIIGTTKVSLPLIDKAIKDYDNLYEYAKSLLDKSIQHNEQLIFNQMYYCLIYYRKESPKHWKIKKELISEIVKNIRIKGYLTSYIEINEIVSAYTNEKRFERFVKGGKI